MAKRYPEVYSELGGPDKPGSNGGDTQMMDEFGKRKVDQKRKQAEWEMKKADAEAAAGLAKG